VPGDAVLEAAGAVIGTIDIDIRNIFDEKDPREASGVFRLANHLHLRTKRSTIRAQLLFAAGDKYSARVLAETERALRQLSYVYDAHVVPVHYADGQVDIRVITNDVWTLSPGISFGRAGGSNATDFKLLDSNFLGWGKMVQISRGSSVDRTSNTVAWADPNVFGSHWTAAAQHVNSSDGRTRSLQVAEPFYSLDAPHSVNAAAAAFGRTVSRYNRGKIVDQFNDDQETYELSGGLSGGLSDGWTRRLLFGLRYDRNIFVPAPYTARPAKQLPNDRTLSYPFVGFDMLEDNYEKVGDENEIGRTEDVYFGTQVRGSVGFSQGVFGADRNALMVAATAVTGFDLPAEQQIFLNGTFSTRIEEGRARNLVTDAGARYYWRWRVDCLLYAAVSGTIGIHFAWRASVRPFLRTWDVLGAAASSATAIRGYCATWGSDCASAIRARAWAMFCTWILLFR